MSIWIITVNRLLCNYISCLITCMHQTCICSLHWQVTNFTAGDFFSFCSWGSSQDCHYNLSWNSEQRDREICKWGKSIIFPVSSWTELHAWKQEKRVKKLHKSNRLVQVAMPMSISLPQFIFRTMLMVENKFMPTTTIRNQIRTIRNKVVAVQDKHYHNIPPIIKKKKNMDIIPNLFWNDIKGTY